jgi:hypothetical protein
MRFMRLVLSVILTISWLSSARSETFQQPVGKPILTISGNISKTNAYGVARFDRDMLWKRVRHGMMGSPGLKAFR